MKKLLTFFICILSVALTPAGYAMDKPKMLEKDFVDNIIHWSARYKNEFVKKGVSHIFVNTNNTKTGVGGFQLSIPFISAPHYLYRVELNFLSSLCLEEHKDDKGPAFGKVGVSGRYIATPNFIVGGYLFYDIIGRHFPQHMINVGIEGIFPSHQKVMMVLDHTFDLKHFSVAKRDRAYQFSFKVGVVKPQLLDIYSGLSYTKHPNYQPTLLWHIINCKFIPPIFKRMNPKERYRISLGLIYHRNPELPVYSFGNLKASVHAHFNFLRQKSNGYMGDYLRMPIDRHLATPYHPSHHSDDLIYIPYVNSFKFTYRPSTPTTEIDMQSNDETPQRPPLSIITPKPSISSLR